MVPFTCLWQVTKHLSHNGLWSLVVTSNIITHKRRGSYNLILVSFRSSRKYVILGIQMFRDVTWRWNARFLLMSWPCRPMLWTCKWMMVTRLWYSMFPTPLYDSCIRFMSWPILLYMGVIHGHAQMYICTYLPPCYPIAPSLVALFILFLGYMFCHPLVCLCLSRTSVVLNLSHFLLILVLCVMFVVSLLQICCVLHQGVTFL
jgi:hypothetical protein